MKIVTCQYSKLVNFLHMNQRYDDRTMYCGRYVSFIYEEEKKNSQTYNTLNIAKWSINLWWGRVVRRKEIRRKAHYVWFSNRFLSLSLSLSLCKENSSFQILNFYYYYTSTSSCLFNTLKISSIKLYRVWSYCKR